MTCSSTFHCVPFALFRSVYSTAKLFTYIYLRVVESIAATISSIQYLDLSDSMIASEIGPPPSSILISECMGTCEITFTEISVEVFTFEWIAGFDSLIFPI